MSKLTRIILMTMIGAAGCGGVTLRRPDGGSPDANKIEYALPEGKTSDIEGINKEYNPYNIDDRDGGKEYSEQDIRIEEPPESREDRGIDKYPEYRTDTDIRQDATDTNTADMDGGTDSQTDTNITDTALADRDTGSTDTTIMDMDGSIKETTDATTIDMTAPPDFTCPQIFQGESLELFLGDFLGCTYKIVWENMTISKGNYIFAGFYKTKIRDVNPTNQTCTVEVNNKRTGAIEYDTILLGSESALSGVLVKVESLTQNSCTVTLEEICQQSVNGTFTVGERTPAQYIIAATIIKDAMTNNSEDVIQIYEKLGMTPDNINMVLVGDACDGTLDYVLQIPSGLSCTEKRRYISECFINSTQNMSTTPNGFWAVYTYPPNAKRSLIVTATTGEDATATAREIADSTTEYLRR